MPIEGWMKLCVSQNVSGVSQQNGSGWVSLVSLFLNGLSLFTDVFSSCYQSNENRSFTLLIRKSPVWGGTTCLQMGMGADARLFFSHDGVQVCLTVYD